MIHLLQKICIKQQVAYTTLKRQKSLDRGYVFSVVTIKLLIEFRHTKQRTINKQNNWSKQKAEKHLRGFSKLLFLVTAKRSLPVEIASHSSGESVRIERFFFFKSGLVLIIRENSLHTNLGRKKHLRGL